MLSEHSGPLGALYGHSSMQIKRDYRLVRLYWALFRSASFFLQSDARNQQILSSRFQKYVGLWDNSEAIDAQSFLHIIFHSIVIYGSHLMSSSELARLRAAGAFLNLATLCQGMLDIVFAIWD